jgi:hypothetical protein
MRPGLRWTLVGLIVLALAGCSRDQLAIPRPEPTVCVWTWTSVPPPEPGQMAATSLQERGILGSVEVSAYGENYCAEKQLSEIGFHFTIPVEDLADTARLAALTEHLQAVSEESAGKWRPHLKDLEITYEQGTLRQKERWLAEVDPTTGMVVWQEQKQ